MTAQHNTTQHKSQRTFVKTQTTNAIFYAWHNQSNTIHTIPYHTIPFRSVSKLKERTLFSMWTKIACASVASYLVYVMLYYNVLNYNVVMSLCRYVVMRPKQWNNKWRCSYVLLNCGQVYSQMMYINQSIHTCHASCIQSFIDSTGWMKGWM